MAKSRGDKGVQTTEVSCTKVYLFSFDACIDEYSLTIVFSFRHYVTLYYDIQLLPLGIHFETRATCPHQQRTHTRLP